MEWTGIWNGLEYGMEWSLGSTVQSRMSQLMTPGCGYVRQPQQLHEQHALLYLLPWAYYIFFL